MEPNQEIITMTDQFKTRLRNHPLAPKRPTTLAVPDPGQQAGQTTENIPSPNTGQGSARRPAFEIPVDESGDGKMTLDSLVALSRNGDTVPMPVSRDMTDKERAAVQAGQSPSARLTKLERDTYVKLGWQEGDPIPPDFSRELKNTFSAYVTQKQAEGIPLDQIKISRIEDLPEAEQVRMKVVLQTLIDQEKTRQQTNTVQMEREQQLSAYPDNVKQVLAQVDFGSLDTAPGTGSDVVSQTGKNPETHPRSEPTTPPLYESGETGTPIPLSRDYVKSTICRTCGRDPNREKQRLVCTHCSCDPLEDPETIPIPIEDKRRYLIALGTKRPFEKEYTIFHDTIQVRFRSLSSRELDEMTLWAACSVRDEKAFPGQDRDARIRYKQMLGSLVLQVKLLKCSIEGSDLFWTSPDKSFPTWSDWKQEFDVDSMDALVRHFLEEIPAEAVILALQDQMTRFNLLEYRLGREGNNTANFWKGT